MLPSAGAAWSACVCGRDRKALLLPPPSASFTSSSMASSMASSNSSNLEQEGQEGHKHHLLQMLKVGFTELLFNLVKQEERDD